MSLEKQRLPKLDPEHRAATAVRRAQHRARRMAVYTGLNQLFNFYPRDFWAFLRIAARWSAIGGMVGVLAGTASAIFLISLEWATVTRVLNPWLIGFLPLAGFGMGWVYQRFGGTAALGNNLVIDEVNTNRSRIPLRMAPMILGGTVLTHLFGGSAGREGTAIQMGASLADGLRRFLPLEGDDRRLLIMAGISGGFGSVFGVPAAGFVFGMEVQRVGRVRYDGLIPCLVAAYVGDIVTRAWGAPHAHYPHLAETPIEPFLLLKVALAGIAFGLTAVAFIELTHAIKMALSRITHYTPLYPVIGGGIVLALTYAVGTTDYLGLSLPLIFSAVGEGGEVALYAFALKLLFTAVTLGSGYLGGEVTPLFVIGSTLGYTLGHLLGVEPALLASIGLVAVFAGASNTPLACAIMGIELFGGGGALYLFAGCAISYLASGHRGIYATQRIDTPKAIALELQGDESLQELSSRRSNGWLPTLPGYGPFLGAVPVRAIMTVKPIAVAPDTTLAQLVEVAVEQGVRSLPVIDRAGTVLGMITDEDIAHALHKTGARLAITFSLLRALDPESRRAIVQALPPTTARTLLVEPNVTLWPQTPIAEAVPLLQARERRPLPVVDSHKQLVGIITRSDILRELAFSDRDYLRRDPQLDLEITCGDVELETAPTLLADATAAQVGAALLAPDRPGGESTPTVPRVVVVDKHGRVQGLLTYNDLLIRLPQDARLRLIQSLLSGRAATVEGDFVAADLMSHPAIIVAHDTPALDAVRLLIRPGIKRVPVLNRNDELLGLVGRSALLRALYPPAAHGR